MCAYNNDTGQFKFLLGFLFLSLSLCRPVRIIWRTVTYLGAGQHNIILISRFI